MNDDVPFEVIMKQAMDLKTSQLAENRRKYDSEKIWFRHSLFAKEVISLLLFLIVFYLVCLFSGRDCSSRVN
jgi:hypothetical protein